MNTDTVDEDPVDIRLREKTAWMIRMGLTETLFTMNLSPKHIVLLVDWADHYKKLAGIYHDE